MLLTLTMTFHSVQFGFSRQTLRVCPESMPALRGKLCSFSRDDGAMMKACAEARCLGTANGGHPVGGIRHAL